MNRTGLVPLLLLSSFLSGAASARAATFDIEVRFLGQRLSGEQKATVLNATARVSKLITSPFAPVRVDVPANSCDQGIPRLKERMTRFVIFVTVKPLDEDLYGESGPCELHDGSYLPIYASIFLNSKVLKDLPRVDLLDTMVHETLHALGVGTLWDAEARVSINGESDGKNFVRKKGATSYYTGPKALAAYRKLGGRGNGIPLDPDAGHWAGNVVCSEILSGAAGDYLGRVNPVGPLTLAALQDLGYDVDVEAADRYALPRGKCPDPEENP